MNNINYIAFSIRFAGNPPPEVDQCPTIPKILQLLGYNKDLTEISVSQLPENHYRTHFSQMLMPSGYVVSCDIFPYRVDIAWTEMDMNRGMARVFRNLAVTIRLSEEQQFESTLAPTFMEILNILGYNSDFSYRGDLATNHINSMSKKNRDGPSEYWHHKCDHYWMDVVRGLDYKIRSPPELIEEQGLSAHTPSKVSPHKRSLVRASYNKRMVDKHIDKIIKIQKHLENYKNQKHSENHKNQKESMCKFVLPDVCDNEIFEQGFEKKHDKLIRNAKIVQRLSDYNVGGGLGKKKRLNRLIAQGDEHRYSGAKKKCPVAIEERVARKSSQVARSVSISKQRDAKSDIVPQMFSMPKVPISVAPDDETLETMKEMSEAIRNAKFGLDEETMGAVDKLCGALSGLDGSTIKHNVSLLDLPSMFKGSGLTFGLASAVLLVFSVCKKLSYTKALLAISGMFMVCYREEIGEKAMEAYRSVISWATSKVEEAKIDDEEEDEIREQSFSGNIVDSIIAFLYYSAAKACDWDKPMSMNLQSFFNKTKDMRKVKDGVEFTFSTFLHYLQMFIDWLAEKFSFTSYNVCMDNMPAITLYSEKVTACVKQFTEGRILNSESARDILDLYTEGSKLARSLPLSIEYAESRKLVQATLGELNPLVMKIRRSNLHNNGPRIQPVGVFLTGPPGVGKTTAITPLMLEVTARTIPPELIPAFQTNHNDFIYNRISENEYFDAYNSQYNVLFDDLGLTRDVAGVNNNPYMEFVRMVNSNSMDLHMAHLEDKGTTAFCSKFVWATSNLPKVQLQSMINNSALTRRFMCSYLVVPAKGYRADENESDHWKMALKPGIQFEEDFPHLEFYEYDALTGQIKNPTPIKLDEVTERIIQVHEFTQTFGKNTLNLHEKFKMRALAKRSDACGLESLGDIHDEKSIYSPLPPDVVTQSGKIVPHEESELMAGESISDMVARVRTKYPNCKVVSVPIDKLLEQGFEKEKSGLKSMYDRLTQNLKRYKDFIFTVYSKLKNLPATQALINNIRSILAGFALITTGYGIYRALFGSSESGDSDADAQSSDYNITKTRQATNKPTQKKKGGEKFKSSWIRKSGKGHRQLRGHKEEQNGRGLVEQLAYDPTCDDILFKVYKKNVYCLYQNYTSEKMGMITFIGGHDAFMPRHFAENLLTKIEEGILPENATIVLRAASNPTVTYEVKVSDIEFFFPDEWEDMDMCFATFPNVLPQAPNIRKYFMEDSEFLTHRFSGKLMLVDSKGSLHVPFTDIHPMSDLAYTNYVNPHGYWYPIPTKDGDCGGLLFISNPLTGTHKIVGFHSAGSPKSGRGYAVRMTKSYIDAFDDCADILGSLSVDEQCAFDETFTTEQVEPSSFKTLFKSKAPAVPVKTAIIPSPLYNIVTQSKCKPAHLRKFESQGKVIDPWLLARAKYAKPSMYMDLQVLGMCSKSYASNICNKSRNDAPWQPKVFSFEDAVRGVPGIPNCEGVPRNTSSGYPFCLDVPPGHKGKTHFFGTGEEYEFISDHCIQLKNRVCDIIAKAKSGIRLKHIYLDFLKDERRPIEKVEKGSTRLVSASPVDILIATRMYFMDFVRWYMDNRIVNGSAVGVNPFSKEWGTIKQCLRGDSAVHNIIAGDFKSYDSCLTRQIQVQFLEFVNDWYDDGNDLIRTVLFEEVCNSKHIYMDLVYEWPGGNPSGNFLTTILNTYCNNVILRYAGVLAFEAEHYGAPSPHVRMPINHVSGVLAKMENQLFVIAYGDDNVISVGENMRTWYNQDTLTKSFKLFGFEYTHEAKGDEVEVLRTIDDVTFLKRSWRFDKTANQVVAPLDLDVVLEMIQWTKRKDVDFNTTRSNVEVCIKELSAHGQDVWDKWFDKVRRAAKEALEYTPTISNRREALSLQLSQEDVL